MGTEEKHIAKARANERFMESITDEYPDWIAVAAFYAAVHWVEAGFRAQGLHNSNKHKHRNDRLKHKFPAVWAEYKPLWNISKLARYEAYRTVTAKKARKIVNRRMPRLRKMIERDMGITNPEIEVFDRARKSETATQPSP